MRFRTFVFFSLVACLLLPTGAVAQQSKAEDPLTGTWAGDWGPNPTDRSEVTVDLKWNGKALRGEVNSEGRIFPIKKGTYDARMGAVHMEADVKARGGKIVHYVIDGKLGNRTLTGNWNHDNRKGDFKITRQ